MSTLEIELEEQLYDLRSDQIAYKLVIRNIGSAAIRLLSLHPRVPHGGELIEVTDSSLAEASERRVVLLEDLNKLLKQLLWVESEPFRKAWIQRQQEAFKEVMSFSGLAKSYYQILKAGPKEWQARMQREFQVLDYKISSTKDAKDAIDRWVSNSESDKLIASLFSSKTEQLEEIESLMNDSDKSSLATIDPASEFTTTYVLRFNRAKFEPLKYQVSFDASYAEADRGKSQVASVATNVQISPYPLSLSLVAILAALLGALISISTESSTVGAETIIEHLNASLMNFVVSPILALIFFNVYEHTTLGGGIRLPVSWRSALLIGALCGIAQDNILAALMALVGA